MESRTLLSGTAVIAPLTAQVGPANTSGTSSTSDLTDLQQPTISGTTTPYALVQLFAQGTGNSAVRPLGETVADPNGNWSLTVGPLANGAYTITGSTTVAGGFPSAPVDVLAGPLIVDTTGPRVAGLLFNPTAGTITVAFQDAGSGLNLASLENSNNYTLVGPNTLGAASSQAVVTAVTVTGFYSSAVAVTLKLSPNAPLAPGRYTFGIVSGGITDNAGNALDGEFSGKFPSGNGVPGGNFLAELIVPRGRAAHLRPLSRHPGARS